MSEIGQCRENPGLWGARVLVVEDDPIIAIDYRFHLASIGALQILAPSAQRAMAYLQSHEVDAAVVDYHLPDGVCTPVIELLIARHVPFVIITGDVFEIRDLPPETPLRSKPVAPAEVCRALSNSIEISKMLPAIG